VEAPKLLQALGFSKSSTVKFGGPNTRDLLKFFFQNKVQP